MEILGLIPARGGSKGIPHKNIAMLAGRPLIAYTCEASLKSRKLTRVIVSTDDPTIADIVRKYSVDMPFLRPPELAQDETPILPVMQHALNWLSKNDAYYPEIVVLLQPTSPLRNSDHIDEAINLLLSTDADSVVSVVKVAHQYNPVSVMKIEDGRLVPFLENEGTRIVQRQDKPKVYARNGPAVLAARREVLLDKTSLYGNDCRPFIMDDMSSIDVDNSLDLEFVEFLLSRHNSENNTADV